MVGGSWSLQWRAWQYVVGRGFVGIWALVFLAAGCMIFVCVLGWDDGWWGQRALVRLLGDGRWYGSCWWGQRRAWFRLFLRLGVLGLGSAFVDSDGAEFLDGWLGFAGRLREKLAGLGAGFLGRPLLDR